MKVAGRFGLQRPPSLPVLFDSSPAMASLAKSASKLNVKRRKSEVEDDETDLPEVSIKQHVKRRKDKVRACSSRPFVASSPPSVATGEGRGD